MVSRDSLGKPKADQAAVLIYSVGPDTPRVLAKCAEYLDEANTTNAGYAEKIYFPLANPGFAIHCKHAHVGGGRLFIRSVGFQ